MDKYLIVFTEQLDAAFKPETLFPDKKFYSMGWLKRKFTIRKNWKKHRKETSIVTNSIEVKYA